MARRSFNEGGPVRHNSIERRRIVFRLNPQITPVESHFQWGRKATFNWAGADYTDYKNKLCKIRPTPMESS